MTSSLVGSEMCIRDRGTIAKHGSDFVRRCSSGTAPDPIVHADPAPDPNADSLLGSSAATATNVSESTEALRFDGATNWLRGSLPTCPGPAHMAPCLQTCIAPRKFGALLRASELMWHPGCLARRLQT
eukprot:12405684-Prorocentrum_lima.AAC.1